MESSANHTNIPLDKYEAKLDIVPVEYSLLIEEALKEDVGEGDITTEAIVPLGLIAEGVFVAKEEGVVCGLFLAEEVFKKVDESLEFGALVGEGDRVQRNKEIARIEGQARSILKGERTALNFIGRLSGISTLTAKFVGAVARTGAKILDTRKTTPGWRRLEKYAVRNGGGVNHRLGLYDMVLVKGNHIGLLGGITEAIEVALNGPLWRGKKVEVEVRNLKELREALSLGVEWVMLDNFSLPEIREAMGLVSRLKGRDRPRIEVSGGVNLKNVKGIAQTGVDYISVGALTHSAQALDVSLVLRRF